MPDGSKKWFMLQVWRVQQVAQILTLVMLAISLSLQVYGYMAWRAEQPNAGDIEKFLFGTPYVGAPLIMLLLAAAIWSFAIFWDLRLKMWRDQATVLMERNPYTKEKMTVKEIILYGMTWLPIMQALAKDEPKVKEAADALREWMRKAAKEESVTAQDLKAVFEYIGADQEKLLQLEKR